MVFKVKFVKVEGWRFILILLFTGFSGLLLSLLHHNFFNCEPSTPKPLARCLRMPVRKMRVDVYDEAGNRYTITFEGWVTRDKAIRVLDLVELLGGMPGSGPEWARQGSDISKVDKTRLIVEKHFPLTWFSSSDVQARYEEEFKEPISLSTVSTYLSRMAKRKLLTVEGTFRRRRYRLITEVAQLIEPALRRQPRMSS